jgi:tetratricopeptide (TPR) repeat protein
MLRKSWTVKPAIILAAGCLAVGIGGGWSIRAWQSPAGGGSAQAADVSMTARNPANAVPKAPSPAQLQAMADAQAAPQLAKLKSDPNNADLLTSIGNVYYDAQQYPTAIDYYGRALKSRPSDAAVRTDMGTAFWYMGNADSAIAEFNKALAYAPTNPNTLFNLGLVKLQGKKDRAGAIADWEKLLAANPDYEGKDKVAQMMADAKTQSASRPGEIAK